MGNGKKGVLFVCYSHTDKTYKERFDNFLRVGAVHENLDLASDANIRPGDDWLNHIVADLKRATAALVLVSQDFMVSPFIQQVELRELLTAQVRRGLRLFLVAVRSTYHEGTYLEKFQWIRPPNQPLSALNRDQQEAAMVEICRKIAAEIGTKTSKEVQADHIDQTIRCLKSVPTIDLPPIYELRGAIADGQFAKCYLAWDRLVERDVVIKVLNTELSRDSVAYDRYVRSPSRLNHKNIQGILFSQANNLPHFLVAPRIVGATLKETLDRQKPYRRLSVRDAVKCTISLARTLAYAEHHKCAHDRLRPSEISFNEEGEPVLKSFRTLDSAILAPMSTPAEKISLEDFLYSSPEARRGQSRPPRSDQYLLGLLAYEMICGSHPAGAIAQPVKAGSNPLKDVTWGSILDPRVAEVLARPTPLDRICRCPSAVSDVIMKMLAENPDDRWDSFETIVENLHHASDDDSLLAKESYRRCAQRPEFYETVYRNLFKVMPAARRMFKHTDRKRQNRVLQDAIWLLLSFSSSKERHEPTLLSGVARTHAHLKPEHFDLFEKALLSAVARHDAHSRTLLAAWQKTMKPGFDYLKSQLKPSRADDTWKALESTQGAPGPAGPRIRRQMPLT